MPTFTCGGLFVQRKDFMAACVEKKFSFSLLNKSIKIIPKVNILCCYWKIVAPGFQIQWYNYEKKFQTASKNTG